MMGVRPIPRLFPPFNRAFLESVEDFTVIGSGELGGKALGLATAKHILQDTDVTRLWPGFTVGIPKLTVVATDAFVTFMVQNNLYDLPLQDLPDERIAHAFMRADLPPLIIGDLRALIARVHTPLAVRSSSLLEDALQHPFAGVYSTKMIPNNEPAVDTRFKRLSEAIKFVWASTFFRDARNYMQVVGCPPEQERMAVIIQEVVGERYNGRFYPLISGVIRTHNYYPSGPAGPEDGVVNLALGLGKTIVDGGLTWSYSPRFPRHPPPFGSARDYLKNTQTRFWSVSMDPAPYDPVTETEFLVQHGLDAAEWDDVLRFTASTYDAQSDRITLGIGNPGARVLTFGPILELENPPLNAVIEHVSARCKEAMKSEVEIEFALTIDRRNGLPARFGFLQVRPMMVADDLVIVEASDLTSDRAIVASERVLGNGENKKIVDIVYVKPGSFEAKHTRAIAAELDEVNRTLVAEGAPYVLIGFGRWGSSDPWLGIPATWSQVSGARFIVEATLPEMNVDASQGSHYFHNMISFKVPYFMVRHTGAHAIAWDWLDRQPAVSETLFLRHVRLGAPLEIRVDGRHGRGVILHN